MKNLKALADEFHIARRASVATGDPLLGVAAYDAWRRFKDGKRKNPQHAVAADAYYRSISVQRDQ
jgi:hypothetical protein